MVVNDLLCPCRVWMLLLCLLMLFCFRLFVSLLFCLEHLPTTCRRQTTYGVFSTYWMTWFSCVCIVCGFFLDLMQAEALAVICRPNWRKEARHWNPGALKPHMFDCFGLRGWSSDPTVVRHSKDVWYFQVQTSGRTHNKSRHRIRSASYTKSQHPKVTPWSRNSN